MAAPSTRLLASLAVRRASPAAAGRRRAVGVSSFSSSSTAFCRPLAYTAHLARRPDNKQLLVPSSSIIGSTRCISSAPSAARTAAASDSPNDDDDSVDGMVSLPANLRIDPRSTCSPFYGMERVGVGGSRDDGDEDGDEDGDGDDAAAVAAESESDGDAAAAAAKGKDGKEAGQPIPEELLDDDDDADSDSDADDYDDEYDSDEEDDEVTKYFDPQTRPLPTYAIPLPARLHIPIHHLPTNSESGTIHLSPTVFGLDPIRPDLIHRVVIYQRNKKRGKRTAITKTISQVRGSGKKVRQQKGLGMARAGHRRPAHWRGGAKAHGPKGSIQDYTTKLNKKVRKLGLKHALSQKLKEGNLVLWNDLVLDSHKTGDLAKMLDGFDIGGKFGATAFVVDHVVKEEDDGEEKEEEKEEGEGATATASVGGINVNFMVASGNLHKVKVVNQLGCNVYDILRHEKLVLTLGAVEALEERLTKVVTRG